MSRPLRAPHAARLLLPFLGLLGVVLILGAASLVLPAPNVSSAGGSPAQADPSVCGDVSYAEFQVEGYPRLWLEVADTPATRQHGLMFREWLDPDAGMLFIFEAEYLAGFWMRNTLIPLSIAWLDSSGLIVDVQDMEPLSERVHSPAAPALYAIESNVGWFAERGIGAGHQVALCLVSSAAS